MVCDMNRIPKLVVLALIIFLASAAPLTPTYAQEGGHVQELTGRIKPGTLRFYLLPDLK